jgi:2-polyprenyl-3-methyl-5-hydroxy-6-metoxy-1,4-benzoquinol methylase
MAMEPAEIRQRRAEIIERFGPWTSHNIQLGDDLYTIAPGVGAHELKLRDTTQLVSDLAGAPLDQLRVLDVGCLEGQYLVELARHGAQGVGLEAREESLTKARFAKEALGLDRIEFVQDDARNVSRENYGEFDVVLCLGLLYHLNVPDVFTFLKQVADVCTRVAVIQTEVSVRPRERVEFEGNSYWGVRYWEPAPTSGQRDLWSSVGNRESFWFTQSSLAALLGDLGFTSVHATAMPSMTHSYRDYITLTAIKGRRAPVLSVPLLNGRLPERPPERDQAPLHPNQRLIGRLKGRVLSRTSVGRLRGTVERAWARRGRS